MTDKILALVDGSIYSESVCHHAAWAASRLSAGVDLLHVLGRREAPTGDLSGALRLGARTALLEELADLDARRAKLAQAKGRAILEDAKAILERDGIAPVNARLRQGDLLEAVAVLEPETRAIVIGKRGEAADFAAGHVGSNLERVVRSVHVPVLVASRSFQPISKVLVAFDASASARRAVERMAGNPVFQGLSVTMVHAGEPNRGIAAQMEKARDRLAGTGLPVATEFVPGEPEAALKRKIEVDGFDLLVMGAYGHSRIRSLIIGSTTTAMVQACRIPVLLYRQGVTDNNGLRQRFGPRLTAEVEGHRAASVGAAAERAPVGLGQQRVVRRLSRIDALLSQAMAAAREPRRVVRTRAIEAALHRIDIGEFGWCETCGEPIGEKRLELDPTLTRCVGCAR